MGRRHVRRQFREGVFPECGAHSEDGCNAGNRPQGRPVKETGFFEAVRELSVPARVLSRGDPPRNPGGGLSGYCPVSVLRPGPSAIAFKKRSVRPSRGFFRVPAGKTFYVLGGRHCALGDAGPLPGARRLAGLPHTERPERETFLLMCLTLRTTDAATPPQVAWS